MRSLNFSPLYLIYECDEQNNRKYAKLQMHEKSTDFINHPICIFKGKRPSILQDSEEK